MLRRNTAQDTLKMHEKFHPGFMRHEISGKDSDIYNWIDVDMRKIMSSEQEGSLLSVEKMRMNRNHQ